MRAQEELQEDRRSCRETLAKERKLNMERVARLQCEIEAADVRLKEERKRAAELLQQVRWTGQHGQCSIVPLIYLEEILFLVVSIVCQNV